MSALAKVAGLGASRRLASGVRFSLVGVWTAVLVIVALMIGLLSFSSRWPLALARTVWAPGVLKIFSIKLESSGRRWVNRDRAQLFVANHRSIADIPVLFAALPVNIRFVIKAELGRVPFIAWYAKAMGMVFLDRRGGSAAMAQIEQAAQGLRDGRSFVAFPEGTRSKTGELLPFKRGTFVAAIRSKTPVVPVAIEGAAEIARPGTFLTRSGTIRVAVGEPVSTLDLKLSDRSELARRVYSRMASMLERSDASMGVPQS